MNACLTRSQVEVSATGMVPMTQFLGQQFGVTDYQTGLATSYQSWNPDAVGTCPVGGLNFTNAGAVEWLP